MGYFFVLFSSIKIIILKVYFVEHFSEGTVEIVQAVAEGEEAIAMDPAVVEIVDLAEVAAEDEDRRRGEAAAVAEMDSEEVIEVDVEISPETEEVDRSPARDCVGFVGITLI